MKLKPATRFQLVLSRRTRRAVLAVVVGGLLDFAAANAIAADALPAPVVAAMTRAQLPPGSLSVYVREVSAAQPLFSVNAELPRNPASVMKLLTTGAALELMGPQFVWRTRLWTRADIVDGVLEGDLYVEAAGDPGLVRNDLLELLRDLRAQGVRRIAGTIRIDRRVFDALEFDEARFDGDVRKPYNAAPNALLLGQKATAIKLMPSADGKSLAVRVDPLADEASFRSDVRLVDGACADWRAALTLDTLPAGQLRLKGSYALDCGVRTWYLNLWSADEYWRQAMGQSWREVGGESAGDAGRGFVVATGPIPADAHVVSESVSAPLALRVRDINKYSNNVMARELLISLGGWTTGKAGSPASGIEAVRDWLRSAGIDAPELVIENGAGLSRIERVSPAHLGQLLTYLYRSRVMPEFIASLPLLALDGTMQRRLVGKSAAGYAHLKSGSLGNDVDPATEVRAIAGYVLTRSGRRYVVVAIANGPGARGASPVSDALIQWLNENG
ncbi:D-alanyl-D-alanine carboxypeptidase/D-alanyl-D-alanine-endopeptidase [soil metagenome]